MRKRRTSSLPVLGLRPTERMTSSVSERVQLVEERRLADEPEIVVLSAGRFRPAAVDELALPPSSPSGRVLEPLAGKPVCRCRKTFISVSGSAP